MGGAVSALSTWTDDTQIAGTRPVVIPLLGTHSGSRIVDQRGAVAARTGEFARAATSAATSPRAFEQGGDFDKGLRLLSESVQSAQGRTAREISDAVANTIRSTLPTTSPTVSCRV